MLLWRSTPTFFPYTTLFRSLLLFESGLERRGVEAELEVGIFLGDGDALRIEIEPRQDVHRRRLIVLRHLARRDQIRHRRQDRSEEHTSELQSRQYLVCRFLHVALALDTYLLSLHDALPISSSFRERP